MGYRGKQRLDAKPLSLMGLTDSLIEETGEPEIVEKEVIVYQPDPNALIPLGDGNFAYKRFEMSPTVMLLPEDASGEEWEEVGDLLKSLDNAVSWWVGDWALFAMHHWNWTAARVAEAFDYAPSTIEVYASVCGSISGFIRNKAVFFSHSVWIAKLQEPMQKAWLDYAAFFIHKQKLKVAEFKQDIQAVGQYTDDEKLDWMQYAIQNGMRLSQIKDLKPPSLSPPESLPQRVIKGKKTARREWKALEGFVDGKITLNGPQVQEKGRALIEWIQALMEASE